MNITELRVEIIRKYGTQNKFAEEIGWHRNKMSKMMRGKYIPDLDEVIFISDKLHLDETRFIEIFLCKKLPNGNKLGEVV